MGMLARIATLGGVAASAYVDDVFGIYTRTGTGASATITNGIDLSTKGGLVITKARSTTTGWRWTDTARGVQTSLDCSSTAANATESTGLTAFGTTGYTIGADSDYNNSSGPATYADFAFRQADKFFGAATVTKSAGSNATASFANLGTLGMAVVKRTDSTSSWYVWHRSLTAGKLVYLEQTAAEATLGHITVSGTTVTLVNGTIADGSYVVYAWAHDTAADGLIQCGGFTTDGSGNATVTLGWEPQFVLYKSTTIATDWAIDDSARALTVNGGVGSSAGILMPNTSSAEGTSANATNLSIKSTGFKINNGGFGTQTYIYAAIRRPNKPPTSGTQIYNAIARTGTGAAATVTGVGFAPDSVLLHSRSGTTGGRWEDRLRGATQELVAETNALEAAVAESITAFGMDGFSLGTDGDWNTNTATYINWCFKRAPGVFDIVCYPGTGSATTVSHGLGVAPELMIVKSRSYIAKIWLVYHKDVGHTKYLALEQTGGPWTGSNIWNDTAPSTSVFTLGTYSSDSNVTYVAYLFATKAGISKVFSYTGNGTNQNIECGFSTGARFVLIKRTDSTGNWLIADTTRGLVSGNDPSLALNSNTAEVTTLDWIDPYSGGFNVVQESTNNANVNNATYIGLAFS